MSARTVEVQLTRLESFKAKIREEQSSKEDILDTEYSLTACFETREQVEAFARWCGEAFDGKFVDGLMLAERLGVDVGPRFDFPDERGPTPRLAALAAERPPED